VSFSDLFNDPENLEHYERQFKQKLRDEGKTEEQAEAAWKKWLDDVMEEY
jgi:hypothetical protein